MGGSFQENIKKELDSKNGSETSTTEIRDVSWDDVYFPPDLRQNIESIIDYLKDPKPFGTEMGYSGVVLTGAPGTGKTLASLLIAKSVAKPDGKNVITINTLPTRNAEKHIRETFAKAREMAPSVILLNECDKYFTSRGQLADISDIRVVDQFLAEMDGYESNEGVVVIADTNNANSLDQALRRPGRFDKEIVFSAPDDEGRKKILDIHLRKDHKFKIPSGNLEYIVENTFGYTGGDIKGLLKEAFVHAYRKLSAPFKEKGGENWTEDKKWNELKEKGFEVSREDIKKAIDATFPSALRGFYHKKPEKSFSDIGGYSDLKRKLDIEVRLPLLHPELLEKYGRKGSTGIMLYGPPRTGKTVLAEAVAKEAKANLLMVRGPEIFNPLFGKSEEAIRMIKEKAVQTAPCILVLDEADSIASSRGSIDRITDSITGQILAEFSPVPKGVYLILTTNRPDKIDEALLSSGRVEKHFYMGLPEEEERAEILKVYFSRMQPAPKLDYSRLAKLTENRNGADLESLYRAVTDYLMMSEISEGKPVKVTTDLVEKHLPEKQSSFDAEYWNAMKQRFGGC